MIATDLVMTIVVTIGTLSALLLGLLFLYENRRKTKYDHELRRMELDALRESLESRIYDLNDRMVGTEERWREANHLLLDSQKHQTEGKTNSTVELTPFLRNAGLTDDDLQLDPKLVFVLTPFHSDFQDTYNLVSDVCKNIGLRALRGDEEYIPTDIVGHIIRMIVRARLVVANLDGRNPNVFYELGIAQALNKPTILISSTLDTIPIDVQSRKIVLADDSDAMRVKLSHEISRTLVEN